MYGIMPTVPPSPAGSGLNILQSICCATPAMMNKLIPLPMPHPFWISSSSNMMIIEAAISCPTSIYRIVGSVGPYTAIPYTTDSPTMTMYVTSFLRAADFNGFKKPNERAVSDQTCKMLVTYIVIVGESVVYGIAVYGPNITDPTILYILVGQLMAASIIIMFLDELDGALEVESACSSWLAHNRYSGFHWLVMVVQLA